MPRLLWSRIKQKQHATTRTSIGDTKRQSLTNDAQEASIGKFKQFHGKLFPIIEIIVLRNKNQRHPFISKWQRVQQGNLKLNENSTFRAVTKALDIKDLQEYRDQIETLPGIHDYVTFTDSHINSNGFRFTIKDANNYAEKMKSTAKDDVIEGTLQENIPVPELSTEEDSITTVQTMYKVCYGSDAEIQEMLMEFWPYLIKFIETNPPTIIQSNGRCGSIMVLKRHQD